MLLVLYGCVVGWNGYGIPYLNKEDSHIHLNLLELTFVPPLFELSRFSSAIPAGILGDVIGRKGVISLCSVLHLFAWSLKVFTTSKYPLYFARVMCGLAVGTGNAVLFIYAGEIAPANIRGMILTTMFNCYYFGILFQFFLAKFMDYMTVCWITLGVSILSFILSFFIKESPSFLLKCEKVEKAKAVHKWLHKSKPADDLNKEFEALKEYVNNQKKNSASMFSGFSDAVNRKSVMLVFSINFLTQLTGLPAVIVFVQSIFKNVSILKPVDCAIIFAGAQLLAGCFSSLLVDKLGRRMMYQVTGTLCMLSHIFTAVLYLLYPSKDEDVPPYVSWMLIMSVSSYACVYAAGLGPLTVIVRGELLPQAVKGIGSGLAVVSAGISCFLLMFLFHQMTFFGMAYNFIFFAVNCVGLLILVCFKLPETKCRTLAEIQDIFRRS